MVYLSVDMGDVRTGLATSTGRLASPLCVITEKSFKARATKVAEKAKEIGAEIIVVGNPVNMDGTQGEKSKKCRDFAKLLGELTGIETVLYDERLTTSLSHKYLQQSGNKKGHSKDGTVDKVSAVILLEDYLQFKSRR
jgi:putative Holliday junction resolvase